MKRLSQKFKELRQRFCQHKVWVVTDGYPSTKLFDCECKSCGMEGVSGFNQPGEPAVAKGTEIRSK